ncbi:MAG TPA: hypothetical protein VMZ91_00090 [Candidatus Paceibacterota bacterium]|nr:hypothetical protein [Candidatus Paceibacterota bacterium]
MTEVIYGKGYDWEFVGKPNLSVISKFLFYCIAVIFPSAIMIKEGFDRKYYVELFNTKTGKIRKVYLG